MANLQLTKRALAQSLKALCEEQSFDKISVRDVVEHCNVNRQTFYYHFSDKYELLDWIYYEEAFLPLTEELTLKNWNEKFCELLKLMKRDKSFYMHTIRCSEDFFEEYLYKILITLHKSAIEKLDRRKVISEEKADIYARFFAHGLTGIVIDWAQGGMRENEEMLAEAMRELLEHGVELFHNPDILSSVFKSNVLADIPESRESLSGRVSE